MLHRQCWSADLESDVLLTAYGTEMYLSWLHRKIQGDPTARLRRVRGGNGLVWTLGLKSCRLNRILTEKIQRIRPDYLCRCEDQTSVHKVVDSS